MSDAPAAPAPDAPAASPDPLAEAQAALTDVTAELDALKTTAAADLEAAKTELAAKAAQLDAKSAELETANKGKADAESKLAAFLANAAKAGSDAAAKADAGISEVGKVVAIASKDFKTVYNHILLDIKKGDEIEPEVAKVLRAMGCPIKVMSVLADVAEVASKL